MKRIESKDQRLTDRSGLKLSLALILAGMGIVASVSPARLIAGPHDAWAISVTGTVTDTACASATHTLVADDALCVRTCVELGANYALAVNKTIYELRGQRAELYKYAGESVQIRGERIGRDTIMVESVVPVVVEASQGTN